MLWRCLSSACACGTHCKRLDPPIFNQDCRPCTHQNSESEPPSIERHRHLIFFSCHLLLKSSPSLQGFRHTSCFRSFFYFVSSIPVLPFLFPSSQTRYYHSQRIGPRRVRRNWSRCFYLIFFLARSTLPVFERHLSLLLSSHLLLTRSRDYHFRYFTRTTPHITRDRALNVCWSSRFSVSSTRESVSEKSETAPRERRNLSATAGRAEWRVRLTSTVGLIL